MKLSNREDICINNMEPGLKESEANMGKLKRATPKTEKLDSNRLALCRSREDLD